MSVCVCMGLKRLGQEGRHEEGVARSLSRIAQVTNRLSDRWETGNGLHREAAGTGFIALSADE